MDDTQRDLRATSDALLQDLEVLIALEEEKRTIPADDERLVELAARIDEVATRVTDRTRHQHDLAADLNDAATDGTAPPATIEAAAPRSTAAILADWRMAERALQDAGPDSPAGLEAAARIDALRAEYQRAYVAVREAKDTGDGSR